VQAVQDVRKREVLETDQRECRLIFNLHVE
jgi:hypothetical protein